MKKVIAIFAIMLLMPSFVFAATFGQADDYTLPSTEITPGNHYAAGANVNIDGEVNGDLIAAGGNVYINNNVTSDATLAGGNLFINGEIGEDLRIGGGNISIFSNVNGELMAGAGIVKIGSKAVIGKDAHIGGGQLIIDGEFAGDLTLAGDEVVFNGQAVGNVFIDAPMITLGENARIDGALHYKTKEAIQGLSAIVAGEITFEQIITKHDGDDKNYLAGLIGGMMIFRFLMTLAFAFIIFAIFKKYTTDTIEHSIKKFGMSLLAGLIVVIVTPIISILLLITLLGAPFTVILVSYAVILSVLAKILASMMLGTLVFKVFKKKNIVNWWTILVGVILMQFVILIPIFGWIFALVLFLTSVGVLFFQTVDGLKRIR
jgi:cytoskeletal protein CcmA (bactofilin family)